MNICITDSMDNLLVEKSFLIAEKDVKFVGTYLYDPMSGIWTYLFLVENEAVIDFILKNKRICNAEVFKRKSCNGITSAYVEVIDI